MAKTNLKILKEKIKAEKGGLASLSRLPKLNFLPKFLDLVGQASVLGIINKRLFLR